MRLLACETVDKIALGTPPTNSMMINSLPNPEKNNRTAFSADRPDSHRCKHFGDRFLVSFLVAGCTVLGAFSGIRADTNGLSPLPSKYAPSVVIPNVAKGPVIDGSLKDPVWQKAVWVGNPVYLNATEVSSRVKMQVGLLWDKEALYVAFEVCGFRDPIAVTNTKGDDGLERDDAVEVCLLVPGLKEANGQPPQFKQPLQFKLNCQGLKDDAIGFNFGWNTKWDGKVTQDGKKWIATFRIPFASVGAMPKVGDQWEGNLGVYLVGYDYRAFLWSPVGIGHHHRGNFGTFQFGDDRVPASSVGPITTELSNITAQGSLAVPGNVRLLLLPRSGEAAAKETMRGTTIANFEDEETKQAVRHNITPVPKAGSWTASLADLRPGDYLLKTLILDEAGNRLNVDVKPLTIRRNMEVKILPYPVAGSASARVSVYNMGQAGIVPKTLTVTVTDPSNREVHKIEETIDSKLPSEKFVGLGKLENGKKYKVLAKATAEDGKTAVDDTVEFDFAPRPEWADTDAGDAKGRVPKPWTPVGAEGATLKCWGRDVAFGKGLLPVDMSSGKLKVLSAPMSVLLGTSHGVVTIQDTGTELKPAISATGDRADFATSFDSSQADIRVSGYMEFDGFIAVDLKVHPKQPITSLALEMPLERDLAKYISPLPGAKNPDSAGTIPSQGVMLDPQNSLWICNDSAGIYFCCESTQNWNGGIEVKPEDRQTLVRFQFRKEGPPSSEPLTYRFYLQTTPVRPFNPDWFEKGSRVLNNLTWGQSEQSLQKVKELGGKTLIFFEHWCSAQNGGWSKREPELKKIVEMCHRMGFKVIFYFGFEIADVPEHKDMLEECKALVNQPANFYSPASQNTYIVSYGSPYQEYLLHHMRRLKEEVGIDGVYLDGSLHMASSDNPAFGAGYINEEGKRKGTVPIERIRRFAKRINELFVQDGGTVFAHLNVNPATMGFVSNCYLGEHVGFVTHDWKSVDELIPPDVARSMYNSGNTGVPLVLCIQNMWPHLRHGPTGWFPRALAWANLYRIGINVLMEDPMAAQGIEVMAQNRARAEFGADTAQWIPYWQENLPVQSEPSELKTSIYRRDDGAMVCAVTNMSGSAVKGTLTLPPGMKCSVLVGGEIIPVNGDKVVLELPAFEGRMLKIEK